MMNATRFRRRAVRVMPFHGLAGRIAAGLLILAALAGALALLGPGSIDELVPMERAGLEAESPIQIRIRSPHGAPQLSNDAIAPMFMDLNMAPGGTRTNCTMISNLGPQRADVRLYGSTQDAGLASFVEFTVEAGLGGGFENCEGFQGATIFRGTLRDLMAAHYDFVSGLRAPQVILPGEEMSFRFTETLSTSAPQGQSAKADFMWEARAAAPTTGDPAGGGFKLGGPEGGAGAGATDDGRLAVDADDDGWDIPRIAMKIAIEIAKRGWIWLIMLVLVALFLVVQDRIDRRDPKLAQARVHPDPDLAFEPPTRHIPGASPSQP